MRGSKQMNNLRVALMDLLGKGKEKFLDFDQAYADALYRENYPGGQWSDMLQYGHAMPLRERYPIGNENFGYQGPRTLQEAQLCYKIDGPLRVANVLSRYALPAGGVTLAGKGLMDIIAALNVEDAMEYHDENISIPFNPNA